MDDTVRAPSTRKTSVVAPDLSAVPEAMRFGKFVRIAKIGAGGMGEVWKAWDTGLSRWVALKFIRPGGSDAAEDLERFKREARTAAALSHPNIAAVFEVGELGGSNYIAMQFIDGVTLKSWRVGAPNSASTTSRMAKRDAMREAVRMVRDAARAVQAAHESGAVHRDLKPDNIMVTSDDERHVFVMDFGLARSTEGASGLTMSGVVIGTPSYMPPEQARGQAVDVRADVYSLGATLYDVLTGTAPFNGSNVYETLMLVTDREPKAPRAFDPAIDRDLETIVLKCLEKDRNRRYATAAEFADELTRWLSGEAIRAHPPSALYKLRKRVGRNPWAWAGLAAAVLAVVAGGAGIGVLATGRSRDRETAERVTRAERLYDTGDIAQAKVLIGEALALRPDHPEARYWRARLAAREYQIRRRLPDARRVGDSVDVPPMPPESADVKALRESAEAELKSIEPRPYTEGLLALWRGDTAAAIDAFGRVPADAPGAWEGELYRGFALYLAGEFERAREPLTRHRSRDPKLAMGPYVQTLLALAIREASFGRDIVALLQEAIAGSHEVPGPHGKVLESECFKFYAGGEAARGDDPWGTFGHALKLLEGLDGIEVSLARAEIFLSMGITRAKEGKLDPRAPRELRLAIDEFTKATEGTEAAFAQRGDAHRVLALHQEKFGINVERALEDALADFERGAKALPKDYTAIVGRAMVRGWLDRVRAKDAAQRLRAIEGEVADLEAAAAVFPSERMVRLALADARLSLAEEREARGVDSEADYTAGLAILDARLTVAPADHETRRRRGIARAAKGARDHYRGRDGGPLIAAAVEDCERAAADAPGLMGVHRDLAHVRQQAAEIAISRGRDPTADLRAASDAVARAIEINPNDGDAHRARAAVLEATANHRMLTGQDASRELADAKRAYERALALNPSDADTLATLSRFVRSTAIVNESEGIDGTAAYEAAVGYAERALALHPSRLDALVARAMASASLAMAKAMSGRPFEKEVQAALRDFGNAVDLHPLDWRGWHHRGLFRQNLTQLRPAGEEEWRGLLSDLDRAVEMAPQNAEALRDRGLAKLNDAHRRGDPEDAVRASLRDFDRAIELNPNDAEGWKLRGSARTALALSVQGQNRDPQKEYQAAWDDLERALKMNQRDPETRRLRGQMLQHFAAWVALGGGDGFSVHEAAINEYTAAIEFNPRDADAYHGRAITRTNVGYLKSRGNQDPLKDYEGALADHRKAVALRPGDAEYLSDLAIVHRLSGDWKQSRKEDAKGDFEASISAFTEALEADPSVARTWLERAQTWMRLRDVDPARADEHRKKALADLAKAGELDPEIRKEIERMKPK